jgi:SAM-dependent methyltransferase
MKARTLAFYESNAEGYFKSTIQLDMSAGYSRFLRNLPSNARILDVGSGSGRDTKYFLNHGYIVDAIDPSPSLAALSSEYTGVQTQVLDALSLDEFERYDGIWACASLLHIPRSELPLALIHLARALKPNGILYASLRHGTGDITSDDGRMYTDMNPQLLSNLLQSVDTLKLLDTWIDRGPGTHGRDVEWFNLLCRKQS